MNRKHHDRRFTELTRTMINSVIFDSLKFSTRSIYNTCGGQSWTVDSRGSRGLWTVDSRGSRGLWTGGQSLLDSRAIVDCGDGGGQRSAGQCIVDL